MYCSNCPLINTFGNISIHNFIESFIRVVEAKDTYTSGHSERVADLSVKLAEKMLLENSEIELIHIAAHLHDIGKIGIADGILLKNTKLSESEFNVIKEHPVIGYRILENVPEFQEVARIVLHHHERFDGNGYPSRLKEKNIPYGARIIQCADAYDAMTSFRAYRKNLSLDEAMAEFKKERGRQFDPEIADCFIDLLSTML